MLYCNKNPIPSQRHVIRQRKHFFLPKTISNCCQRVGRNFLGVIEIYVAICFRFYEVVCVSVFNISYVDFFNSRGPRAPCPPTDTLDCNENVFPSQRNVILQQKHFSFSKTYHTATNTIFLPKNMSYSNKTTVNFPRQFILQRKHVKSPFVKLCYL